MNYLNNCQIKHVLKRKRNVFQRCLFYTQKQMFNNKTNTENYHFGGYIFYVFIPINLKFRYCDINL